MRKLDIVQCVADGCINNPMLCPRDCEDFVETSPVHHCLFRIMRAVEELTGAPSQELLASVLGVSVGEMAEEEKVALVKAGAAFKEAGLSFADLIDELSGGREADEPCAVAVPPADEAPRAAPEPPKSPLGLEMGESKPKRARRCRKPKTNVKELEQMDLSMTTGTAPAAIGCAL